MPPGKRLGIVCGFERMCGLKALRLALDLRHVPSRVHYTRDAPLPEGLPLLLRIVAGDPAAEREAMELVDRPLDKIREAAGFFIEQILFAPRSDSYRVLGGTADATAAELRRNMALLVRWLHFDANDQSDRRVFMSRVARAWNDVKTPERRAAYDRRVARMTPTGPAGSCRRQLRRNTFPHAVSLYAAGGPTASDARQSTGMIGLFLSFLSRARRL